ncbi:hypothetical protein SH661x_003968 [Planctomicrobium sp. SH661]|uniref:hypothetical protein n=1 Tax=Planctomicrobium sp. SH661 TaxID=3448124 RepID=UPI003F5CB9CC
MRFSTISLAAFVAGLLATQLQAENIYGLKPGNPEPQTASALAFGPDGILFIGDAQGATIYAVETSDAKSEGSLPETLEGVDQQIAKALDTTFDVVKITDLAVNPETKNVFIAAQVEGKAPRIFKLEGGKPGLTELELSGIPFSSVALPNAAEDKDIMVGNRKRNNRGSAITDLAFVEGQLVVAGLSNDKAASNVWSLKFPFQDVDQGTSLEFYHGAHGRSEDYAPIRTFVPFIVNGEPNLLAGFVCTPLVKFPLTKLAAESKQPEKVQGTTVAELGNRNQPLDMISYKVGDKDFLLLSNSARGVMKVSTENIERDEGITSPIPDGKTSGQAYETIESLAGTVQMDKLDDKHAVVLIQKDKGPITLKVVELP